MAIRVSAAVIVMIVNIMPNNKKYTGCKSWLCHQCRHYQKFLTIASMQNICWNRGCFYENKLVGRESSQWLVGVDTSIESNRLDSPLKRGINAKV